ncbi:MAG: hypothetical protein R6W91_03760 [Thermoplasmata archaeon]
MGNATQNIREGVKTKQDIGIKPKCPYYQDSGSELVCPYFMLANHVGPGGAAPLNGRANWAGIASLVLGIICISMCWFSLLLFPALIFIVMSILGIIFGGIGLRNGARARNGKVAAGAGLVLGILSLVFTVILVMIRLSWGYYY